MDEILNIHSGVVFDESIAHYEVHAHQPYSLSQFNNSDEIRISIQHQDLCLLPSRSNIHICGRLTKENGTAATNTELINNAICHLFEDIRYEINAIEIDKIKNVGLTSLMKNWLSLNPNQSTIFENAGWIGNVESQIENNEGYFDVSIPLSMLLGFAEDYRKIVVNVKHELILTRSRNDLNATMTTPFQLEGQNRPTYEKVQIHLTKIEWLMPYVVISDREKIKLFNHIGRDKAITMSYRTWELYEYPKLPTSSKHVWSVKTSNQLEKPRFVILAFQTKRKSEVGVNASNFDHCNISNVKLFLNSQCYPYGNLNLNITQNQYAILYDMYANFQNAYYGKENEPMLNKKDFIEKLPLIVIDCSKQNESIKSAPVDVRLEFESRDDFPDNTAAYCLILHDRIVQYNPIKGDVTKVV